MRRGPALLFLGAWLVLGGCSSAPETKAPFPLKIGLLADSQITSQNGYSDFHFRSKDADALVDVSIRPPGLECVLAEEMLEVALTKLTGDTGGDRAGVDVILYLGDGANSGGADEIDTVLRVLGEHRDRTGTPIFIIIGNHDYLGTGNIVTPGTRFALLNRPGQPENLPLTKFDVLVRFSQFNRANNRLSERTGIRYVDNIAFVDCNPYLEHDTGMYLAGLVSCEKAGREPVEIVLLDSSDYKDAPGWSEVADLGFYGVIGSVSFKDEPGFVSQLSYVKALTAESSADFRLLASHYPKDHLDRVTFAKPGAVPLNITNRTWDVLDGVVTVPTFTETMNDNLQELLVPGKRNYWMSAHTHADKMRRPEKHVVGGFVGQKYFRGVNVGSTTDYRAHVAIIEPYDRRLNDDLDDAVGYREIPLCQYDDALQVSLTRAIGSYGRDHAGDPMFRSLIVPMDEWHRDPATGWGSAMPGRHVGTEGKRQLSQAGPSGDHCGRADLGATQL
ncbi:MAG: hypothetical protein GY716_20080 [bacterium]|nr:hypothetical protein [bacterium]